MSYTRFHHLYVPDQWRHYWTKYPEGYTILEALLNWVRQVDNMVDNQNQLNINVENMREELDEFLKQFDDNLADEVIKVLSEWQASGFLDIVIDHALQTQIDKVEAELPFKADKKAFGVFIKDFPKLEGEIDDTPRLQRAIDKAHENYNNPAFGYATGGVPLFLEAETYVISGTGVYIKSGVEIRGQGIGSTILNGEGMVFDGTNRYSVINRLYDSQNQLHNAGVFDLDVRANTNVGGIRFYHATLNCMIERVRVKSGYVGIQVGESWTVKVRDCQLIENLTGINASNIHASIIEGNRIEHSNTGVYVKNGFDINIRNNIIQNCRDYGIRTLDIASVIIEKNYFEWNCRIISTSCANIFID